MKRFTLGLLPLVVLVSGCVSANVRYIDEADFASLLNAHGEVKSAEIVMRTGEQFKANDIVIKGDSIAFVAKRASWSGAPSGAQTVAFRTVRSVTFAYHGEGAVEGLANGASDGVDWGPAISASSVLESECLYSLGRDCEDEILRVMILGATTAIVAPVFGGLHGLISGKQYRFEFGPEPVKEPSAPTRLTPTERAVWTLFGR